MEFEKYNGGRGRHTCPNCGKRQEFTRYIDDDGNYFADNVGICNRKEKCGYHYPPKQFFADNPEAIGGRRAKGSRKRGKPNYAFTIKNGSAVVYKTNNLADVPDYIPLEMFEATLGDYEQNAFVEFLLNLYPDCGSEVEAVLKMYFVGTYDGLTCFWQIDRQGKIRTGKIMSYDLETGKRQTIRPIKFAKGEIRDIKFEWMHKKIKREKDVPEFILRQVFFGEHLAAKNTDKPIAIVEAEKTAIIASICFPELVWLAAGGLMNLNVAKILRFSGRRVILYPDANPAAFDRWSGIAADASAQGLNVKVSTLIENRATDQEKADGYDLADYLINESLVINKHNEFVDSHNAKLETN
jgi:hypothetical protein